MFQNYRYFNKIFSFLSVLLLVFLVLFKDVHAIIFSFQRIDPAPITLTNTNGDSQSPIISENNLFVVFDSAATNLVSNDTNSDMDVFLYSIQDDSTSIVSVNSDGDYGNDGSSSPDISSTGRYITFISDATNLVTGDTNGFTDVFLHDTQTGTTTRVSVDSLGNQANASSYAPKISADGRYVTFSSWSDNLAPGDINSSSDVFLHDTQTGTTTIVSVDSLGSVGDGYSAYSKISADGRYIIFDSESTNLVSGDTNFSSDVFLHDTQTGTTTRVSVDSLGGEALDYSYAGYISSTGRYITFISDATNLVTGDTNGFTDVFLHDTQTGTTTRVSVDSLGNEADSYSYGGVVSGNGRYIVFYSDSTNLDLSDSNSSFDVFLHDTQTGTTTRVSVDSLGNEGNGDSTNPYISSDGENIIFMSDATNLVPGDTNGFSDIFWYDTQLQDQIMISNAVPFDISFQANGHSYIGLHSKTSSRDGRYIVFESSASNFVSGDTNGFRDVFLHDTQTGTTTRVSVDSLGNQANADSGSASISGDGRFVIFTSTASNLVSGDTNLESDVFLHDTQTGITTRVSVDSLGNENDAGITAGPFTSISDDGRFITFTSSSTNLVPGDTNGSSDVFLHDTQTSITTRVSVDSLGNQGNNNSGSGYISQNNRYIAFLSAASNLVLNDTNGEDDVFLHDTQTGTTTRVSVDSLGNEGDGESYLHVAISNDNRYVYFFSDATNLVSNDTNNARDVFQYEINTGNVVKYVTPDVGATYIDLSDVDLIYIYPYIYLNGDIIDTFFEAISLSQDGQNIIFADGNSNGLPDTNGFSDIFYSEIIFASLSYSGNFTESSSNDGSITGERIITITNDTFVNSGGTLTLNTHYTLDNVPDGLTPVLSVSQDGATAILTFTGSAASHANINDVSNLTITFLDSAFTLEDIALSVTNYTNNQGVINFLDVNEGGGGGSSGSNPNQVPGCTDSDATNYNPNAVVDNGSCIYTPGSVPGCTDVSATNYNPLANVFNNTCVYGAISGCTDVNALNFNSSATVNDGSCEYAPGTNPPPDSGGDDDPKGCTDLNALNFNSSAIEDDGSCLYESPDDVFGCTDASATNYNPLATVNSNDCEYINPPPGGNPPNPIKEVIDIIENIPSGVKNSIPVSGVVVPSLLVWFLQPGLFAGIFSTILRILNLIPFLMGYKRERRPWGTVYDSVTKQPLDPVYVSLKNEDGQEISSSITDMDGRYGFLAQSGLYKIFANKDNYIFPSAKMFGKTSDELYDNLYFGENLEVKEKEDVVFKNIPMDAINFNWNEFEKSQNKKLMKFYSKRDLLIARFANILFVFGLASSIIIFFVDNSLLNTIVLSLYGIILLLRIFGIKPKQAGYVFDKSGFPLSFAILRLYSSALDREVAHTVVGQTGKYYMLVKDGQYYIKLFKKTGEDSYEEVYKSSDMNIKNGFLKKKIRL